MAARSYLYVPGDRPDRLEKAGGRAGDAIIADLEDAVVPDRKARALEEVRQWLAAEPAQREQGGREQGCRQQGGREHWVRVNAGPRGLEEIAELRDCPALHGVLLPKADRAAVRAAVAATQGRLRVAALIESARGLLEVAPLAAEPGVSHLGIGEADLAADLSLQPSPDACELLPLRLQLVVASAAAALPPPTGPVWLDVRDLDGLRESCVALRRCGFGSRSAIHPDQVRVIEEVFTPTAQEVDAAQAVVRAHEAALAGGTGVVLDDRGRLVDEAVVRTARRTVEVAARLSS
jgi:citrate lyase subunit beta/citryl-CoA lyase